MANKITEQYFTHTTLADNEKKILDIITKETNFKPEKEISRGQIYNNNKVGSLIYSGFWEDRPAVLKIQILKIDIDEIDIISKFNNQNQSHRVRLPQLYKGLKWNEKNGYGYLILEYIDAPKIYQPPFANQSQIKDFCSLYQEYKTKSIIKPFIEQEITETSTLFFTSKRILHWAKIAQSKGSLNKYHIKNIEEFLSIAGKHLPTIKMEFMHGHLTPYDIFKFSDQEYVLMSNLFWSYRPEFYDSTFHLWMSIKSLRDQSIKFDQIIQYIQNWLDEYKKIPIIMKDNDFEKKFNISMAERCIGAILLDITNQDYENDSERYISHLTQLFSDLFKYFSNKL